MTKEQIQHSFDELEKALQALQEAVNTPMQENKLNIDGTIQRFEFTIELFWKLLKRILASKGIEVYYPKEVLREAYAGFMIDDEAAWIRMLQDRNMTSHTYNEDLADKIYHNVKNHYAVLKSTFDTLKKAYYV